MPGNFETVMLEKETTGFAVDALDVRSTLLKFFRNHFFRAFAERTILRLIFKKECNFVGRKFDLRRFTQELRYWGWE